MKTEYSRKELNTWKKLMNRLSKKRLTY